MTKIDGTIDIDSTKHKTKTEAHRKLTMINYLTEKLKEEKDKRKAEKREKKDKKHHHHHLKRHESSDSDR